jgi:hypothetical protein
MRQNKIDETTDMDPLVCNRWTRASNQTQCSFQPSPQMQPDRVSTRHDWRSAATASVSAFVGGESEMAGSDDLPVASPDVRATAAVRLVSLPDSQSPSHEVSPSQAR